MIVKKVIKMKKDNKYFNRFIYTIMFQHVFHLLVLIASIYNVDTPLLHRNVLVLGTYFTAITFLISIFLLFISFSKEKISFWKKIYAVLSYLPSLVLLVASLLIINTYTIPVLTISIVLVVTITVLIGIYISIKKRI